MSKQELYDYVYSMMKPCFEKARQVNRNTSYEVFKKYLRDNNLSATILKKRIDDHLAAGGSLADYMNVRQEFLRHVSNTGCDRAVFDELFEPYRLMWHNAYGDDFKGVVTNKPYFWRMPQG
jgi:hypothetical protein